MTICKFWQQGFCRNGEYCKFEHPSRGNNYQNQNQPQNQNRFGALLNPPNPRNQGGQGLRDGYRPGQRPPGNVRLPGVDPETIKLDLTVERPIWPFSVYGPGRNAPKQLLEGAMEQSPEEVRLQYYLAMYGGNAQRAQQAELQEFQNVQRQIDKVLADLDGAVRYVVDGERDHPNRIDLCKDNANQQQQPPSRNPFGSAPTGPAALSQPRATFGAPSFGQPSTPQSGFGKPSFGQATSFGNPSPMGQASGFGRPSPLGQATTFGQTSTPAANPAFGQPSFSKPSAPNQPSGFGQPSFPNNNSPFNQNQTPFAQGTPQSQPSGFGQPSFSSPPKPFGAQQTSTFGQPSQPSQPNPFGAVAGSGFNQAAPANPSPFNQGAQAAAPSPFGTQPASSAPSQFPNPAFSSPFAQQQSTASPFNQPTNPNTGAGANPFGQPAAAATTQAQSSTNGVMTNGTAAAVPSGGGRTANITRDARNNIIAFNGHPVRYIEGNAFYLRNPRDPNSLERIWFTDDAPPPIASTDVNPDSYTNAIKDAYKYSLEHGEFKDGIMPEVPPTWEMNAWGI